MKKLLIGLVVIIMFIMTSCATTTIPSETYIPSESSSYSEELKVISINCIKTNDLNELDNLINECIMRMDKAKEMENCAEILGYDEVVLLAQNEWNNTNNTYNEYLKIKEQVLQKLEQEKWNKKMIEYPVATKIWIYMKSLGWSDYVCAGIMGNMMAEVGGQTLNINYNLYDASGGCYGICQWTRAYYGSIHGAGLEAQLNYLRDTIEDEFNSFGYKGNTDYETFMNLQNVEQISLQFAQVYERCGVNSYSTRQNNALIAYEYFVFS